MKRSPGIFSCFMSDHPPFPSELLSPLELSVPPVSARSIIRTASAGIICTAGIGRSAIRIIPTGVISRRLCLLGIVGRSLCAAGSIIIYTWNCGESRSSLVGGISFVVHCTGIILKIIRQKIWSILCSYGSANNEYP